MTPLRRRALPLSTVALAAWLSLPAAGAPAKAKADDAAIRPFRAKVPEAALADLRKRTVATRWPWEQPELFAAELRAAFKSLR